MKTNPETSKTSKTTKGQVTPLTNEEKAAVNAACMKHAPMIKSAATEFVRPGSSVDLEDLMQIGYETVAPALREWDPDGGASFASILNLRIRSAFRTAVGVRKKKTGDFLRGAVSLDEPYDDGEPLRDLIGEDATQEREYSDKELAQVLDNLSDDDRELLQMSAKGMTDLEIADERGVDRSGVSRKLRAARKSLVQAMNDFEPYALEAVA